ncbi:competence pheromone ComX [Paenibacillus sp. GCM10027629]|uniref:competence pheromone ComX n=1 Tax=Paenibacillus sp. GCM10027629 TaxID=3273414 RepID=UPI00363215F2
MIKQMINYLTNNPQVPQLVMNGQASLVGVTPAQQKTIVDTITGGKWTEIDGVRRSYWFFG